jgi:peroxiredoxin
MGGRGNVFSLIDFRVPMVTSLCLMSCVFAAAQSADRSEWLLLPRLSKAQEIVYRGSYTEEAVGAGVQFSRTYRLESRIVVLDANPKGVELALLTVLKPQAEKKERGEDLPCVSSRLELAKLDLQGRLTTAPGVSLTLPLDGPPSLECGAFLETPNGRLKLEQTWEANENGRPIQTWKVEGTATVGGVNCLKVVGVQQSNDWDKPRADHTAWRRTDTVCLIPRQGIAQKVERLIECREPARKDPSRRYTVSYDLDSTLQYPAQLFEDRRREITQIHTLGEAAAPLLVAPAKNSSQLETLQGKIAHFLEDQPSSPFREAAVQLKRRVEAARRGDPAPVHPAAEVESAPSVAKLGYTAPDFLASDFDTKESIRPRRWLGKPVLMVFFNPSSQTAEELLRFAQATSEAYGKEATVVGFAMSDDGEKVRKQRSELKLTIGILSGLGLRKSYDVEATPKLIVLDAEGVVRGSYEGWGQETAGGVQADLRKSAPRPNVIWKDAPPMKK